MNYFILHTIFHFFVLCYIALHYTKLSSTPAGVFQKRIMIDMSIKDNAHKMLP